MVLSSQNTMCQALPLQFCIEGLKQSRAFAASSQKSKLKNGAQGHCNSQTCRVLNDTSRPQIY